MDCPRRVAEGFASSVFNYGPDEYREGRCSWCGSMEPGEFMRRAEAGEELTPTDKNYKVYVGERDKFYFQHLDEQQKRRFVDLFNAKKLKLGYPGRFYVPPFFMRIGAALDTAGEKEGGR